MKELNSLLIIGPQATEELLTYVTQPSVSQVFVLVDSNTARHCYPVVQELLPPHTLIELPAGEEFKTLASCELVWEQLTEKAADRSAVLVNLGGGVITDLGGFCAATYKRGIRFVQVPTTLLAQVDASVGGKTGVDFHGFKNHIGVFQEPAAVYIAPQFLRTLDERQLRSGYAEIVKHWLIADAPAFAAQRHSGIQVPDWTPVIEESVATKQRIVEADPLESGLRKVLNFGHTVGHALESYLLLQAGREILHGEAVAAGMICEAWLSVQKGLLSLAELESIEAFLLSVYEKVQFVTLETDAIAQLAVQDKKNRGTVINCTLLHGIGRAVYDQPVTVAEIAESLRHYHRL